MQIVFGLICDKRGCPIAVEVFTGNTSDTTTITTQIEKVRHRFGLQQVVWVGDRGMITQTPIREDFKKTEGLDWITALRASQIRKLVEQDAVQLSLFDEKNLVEFSSPDYPGERLIACRNPFLAQEKSATREALLQATEKALSLIVSATKREKRALKGADQIGLRVGKILNSKGVGKYFNINITSDSFSFSRKQEVINEDRVKAHVFLCMLAYYVEWHMRKSLAPLLFDDEKVVEESSPSNNVATPQKRSKTARAKAARKKKFENFPIHSFRTLMEDLATIAKNKIQSNCCETSLYFEKITQPTSLQQKALDLLRVSLFCTQ